MALWQIMNPDWTAEMWDDGLKFYSWEAGFTTSLVIAHAAGRDYQYVGTPNWEPPPGLVSEDDEEA